MLTAFIHVDVRLNTLILLCDNVSGDVIALADVTAWRTVVILRPQQTNHSGTEPCGLGTLRALATSQLYWRAWAADGVNINVRLRRTCGYRAIMSTTRVSNIINRLLFTCLTIGVISFLRHNTNLSIIRGFISHHSWEIVVTVEHKLRLSCCFGIQRVVMR